MKKSITKIDVAVHHGVGKKAVVSNTLHANPTGEFVSSLVRLGRENLRVLINISCHNGRGGGGRTRWQYSSTQASGAGDQDPQWPALPGPREGELVEHRGEGFTSPWWTTRTPSTA